MFIEYIVYCRVCFIFNHTATTEIYTLSLHDALPISPVVPTTPTRAPGGTSNVTSSSAGRIASYEKHTCRSEEHTSELQSRQYLVCRLLLEKKKNMVNGTRQTYVSLMTDPNKSRTSNR